MFRSFKTPFLAAVMCVATLSGCATKPATFAQKDPQVDLYAFKTFAFYEPAPGAQGGGYGTIVSTQIRQATRVQMENRGYVYDATNPDLRVNIVVAVRDRTEIRSAPASGPLPYRAWGATKVESVDYREGTLAVDLVDAKRRTMVWRGVVQDRLTRKDLEKVEATVRDAVKEVFAKYPVKA